MPPTGRMRHLITVRGAFHGRVLVARLGAAGVLAELRGALEGPYPLPSAVEVFVAEDDLQLAREILLGDAVDDAVDAEAIEAQFSNGFEEGDELAEPGFLERGLMSHPRTMDRLGRIVALTLVVVLVLVGLASAVH